MNTSDLWLTPAEKKRIQRYRSFYESLASGERPPTTLEQEHFVAVAHGKAHPQTEHEVSFLKFFMLLRMAGRTGLCDVCKSPIDTVEVFTIPIPKKCSECEGLPIGVETEAPEEARPEGGRSDLPMFSGTPFNRKGPDGLKDQKPAVGNADDSFAGYNYDKVSPHGIPRKRRK